MNASLSPRVDIPAGDEKRSVALWAAKSLNSKTSDRESNYPEDAQSRKYKAQEMWCGTLSNERQKRNQHKATEPCRIKLKTTATVICPRSLHLEVTRATPNDLKLSEPRGWRDRCVVAARRRPEAAGVTAARVRCSAWLGVATWVESMAHWRPKRWLGTGKLPPVAVTREQMRRATPDKTR